MFNFLIVFVEESWAVCQFFFFLSSSFNFIIKGKNKRLINIFVDNLVFFVSFLFLLFSEEEEMSFKRKGLSVV